MQTFSNEHVLHSTSNYKVMKLQIIWIKKLVSHTFSKDMWKLLQSYTVFWISQHQMFNVSWY